MEIKLQTGRIIGDGHPAYIIAEVGINHNGSFAIAQKLIDIAAFYEIDAIKFQKRTLRDLFTQEHLSQPYNNGHSFGATYGEHKQYLEFSNEQFIQLKQYAQQKKIDFLVSGFDFSGFDFINNILNVPIHKIPSPYVNHYPLLKHVAQYGKPMVLSTGMHSLDEVSDAVKFIKSINDKLVVLQCTSKYPIENSQANLNVMKTYRENFDTLTGYSSHDKGIILPVAAVAMGACVVEKHFTFDRTAKGADHSASVENRGLELIRNYIRTIEAGIGDGKKVIYPEEESMRIKYGISVVAKSDIRRGTILSYDHINYKIPGGGIKPKDIEKYIGKQVKRDIKPDEILYEVDLA